MVKFIDFNAVYRVAGLRPFFFFFSTSNINIIVGPIGFDGPKIDVDRWIASLVSSWYLPFCGLHNKKNYSKCVWFDLANVNLHI